MTQTQTSFTDLFSRALQGSPVHIVGLEDDPKHLPVQDWTRDADPADLALLDLCPTCTIDIGCGPGRLTSALAARGQIVLGIDIVSEAVGQTRLRGAAAVVRDVFKPMPGEGRWQNALLADGNIGIGGDPVALLARARELISDHGRIVVEVKETGVAMKTLWATLECGDATSRPFRWAIVGLDDIEEVAARAGLVVTSRHPIGDRWAVVLQVHQ
ncbi:MAG: class I SAM-dependent methyltransferase [Ornithinimicrobium sp.]